MSRPSGDLDIARAAASTGDLARVQLVHSHGYSTADIGVLAAALRSDSSGSLEVEDWLLTHGGCVIARDRLTHAVASSGDLAKVQWLRERGLEPAAPFARVAAKGGHIPLLQHLKDTTNVLAGPEVASIMQFAVQAETPAAAEWVELERTATLVEAPPEYDLYVGAAVSGRLDNLRWLLSHPVYGQACAGTAVLRRIIEVWPDDHRVGGPWKLQEAVRLVAEAGWTPGDHGPAVLCQAAKRGSLPLVCYTHEVLGAGLEPQGELGNSDPRVKLLACAVKSGSPELVEWLVLEKGALVHQDVRGCMGSVAELGDLGMVECIRRLGVALVEGVQAGLGPEDLRERLRGGGLGEVSEVAVQAALAWAGRVGNEPAEAWLRAQVP